MHFNSITIIYYNYDILDHYNLNLHIIEMYSIKKNVKNDFLIPHNLCYIMLGLERC